ncbi:carbohydrate ABC transporter permease [Robertmurraya massiliosenegalensis]|uniref:carbohydrate ABC transporter permease n=1 Tax=Robertmurraya massiliosenegalensis TaxID=1287657 RepID=UPI0002F86B62|nr:sugar ABC transporter permease [Robertmurraya massiliosenegalensis]
MDNKATIWQILLYVLIPLIPLVIFWILPLIVSVWLSFTNWDYISPTYEYVGISNYTNILSDKAFLQALVNTIFFALATVVPILFFGFVFAVMLNRLRRNVTFLQGIMFAPWITPMIGMSIVWSWMFDPRIGPINQFIGMLGLTEPKWLTDSDMAMWAVIIVTIWKNIGWAILFFSDALSKIPKGLFEVADVEGASWWYRVRDVLIPLVSPTTLFLFIILTLDSLQAYDQINVLTQGGPAGSTRTLLYLYYEMAFQQFNMGAATAVAVLILIISALLAFISMKISKKYVFY